MALYEVTSPNGFTYELDGPDDASQEDINKILEELQASEVDTGQGAAVSTLTAVPRGFVQGMGSLVEGIGDITGTGGETNFMQGVGRDIKAEAGRQFVVNPNQEDTFAVKAGGVVGGVAEQAAELLGPAALGLGAKALRGLGLVSAAVKGADSGEDVARQFGVDEDTTKRSLLMAGFGAAEAGSEMLGGFGAEAALAKLLSGQATEAGLKGFGKAVLPEYAEEAGNQILQNTITNAAITPEEAAAAGLPLPGILEGANEAGLLGLAGGGVIASPILFQAPPPSSVISTTAEAEALAANDPAAAAIHAEVQGMTKMIPVPLPQIDAAPEGDLTLDDLMTPLDANTDTIVAEDLPVPIEGLVEEPVIAAPEMDISGDVLPVETPELTAVEPVVTEEIRAPEITPEVFASEPVLTPEQDAAQKQWESSLIDRQGRIAEPEAVKVFDALKALGATGATLVVNNTGRNSDVGPTNEFRGSRTVADGVDTIYLNRNTITADTPLHEVGHGFIPEMRNTNPQLYQQGQALVQAAGKDLSEAIKARYARRGIELNEEDLLHETLTTLNGNENTQFWRQYVKNPALIQQIQQWIAQVRAWVDTHLSSKGIDPNITMAEFARKVNRQVLAGKMRSNAGSPQTSNPDSRTDAQPSLSDADRFNSMLAAEDARKFEENGRRPWRVDGVQNGYESEAPDAKVVPQFVKVTITDLTHPAVGSSIVVPVEGRALPLSDEVIQAAVDAKRSQQFSLNAPMQSGLAANYPGTPVYEMAKNAVYNGESFQGALDQVAPIYDQQVADAVPFDDMLATLKEMVENPNKTFYNLSPGTYFGLILRDLTAVSLDPEAAASDKETAAQKMKKLVAYAAATGASGGQLVKGFDFGLKIANNPTLIVQKWDDLAPFDGSEKRREQFEQERDAAMVPLAEFEKEAVTSASDETLARTVEQGLNDVIKGEEASDNGAAALDEAQGPEIAAAQADAEIINQDWFQRAVGSLSEELQTDTAEWLMMLKALDLLNSMEGELSLADTDIDAGAQAMLARMKAAGLNKTQQIAQLKKDIAAKQKKIAAKTLSPSPSGPVDMKGMVIERLNKNLERLLNGKAKKKKKALTQQQIATAISTAILSKAGYTGVPVQGDMAAALGLLLANQETAAASVQDIHTLLQADESSAGMITLDKLKAFMQLAIGKTFDTSEGASEAAAPYGEAQIAGVLRTELKRLDADMTKIVKDAAMVRSTAEALEKQLRDPKRGLSTILTPEAMDNTVAAVLREYNKTAKQRATDAQRRADQIESDKAVREAARDAKEKRTNNYRQQKKKRAADIKALNERIKGMTPSAQRTTLVGQRDALLTAEERAEAEFKAQQARDQAESDQAVKDAEQDAKTKRREFIAARRRARAEARSAVRKAKGLPEALDYDETKALAKVKDEKIIQYLARQFGFDLSSIAKLMREDARRAGVQEMTLRLADALGLSQEQAQKFTQTVVAEAMKTMDASRKKAAENKVRAAIDAKTKRNVIGVKKKGQPTEAERLIRLVEQGGLTVDNVEAVMLNTLGAEKFSEEFKDTLTRLIYKSNDPNLPQSSRDQYTQAFLGMIRSARGVSALGLWGEWTMSNIFFGLNTFKVNAFWGGIKSVADTAVYLATAPSTVTVDGQKVKLKGVWKALLRQWLRGYSSNLQYHRNYIVKTGKSPIESDMTTQFANSDFEIIAEYPETEIRAWMDGRPLSPAWGKRVKILTHFNKYVRRIMVGTDIWHRTPVMEMLKAMSVVKLIAEKGGTIPNNGAAWQKAIDDVMYGGNFDQAVADAKKQVDNDIAAGRVAERERGIRFGEILDGKIGETLGLPTDERAKLLEQSVETAKRWTVANQTEGIMGVISNKMLEGVRDIPGLKFLLPAIRMPIGAFAQGMDWSPYGFLRELAIKQSGGVSSSFTNLIFNKHGVKPGWNVPAGGVTEERALDLRTKAMIGTSAMIGIVIAAAMDMDDDEEDAWFYITGKGPESPAQSKLWRDRGFTPFMMKIGPMTVNYRESPAYAPLAAIGAWSDTRRYSKMTDTEADKLAYVLTRSMSSFADAAVLKNLTDALGSVTGGGYASSSAFETAGKATTRLAGVALFPRIGAEINQLLYGPQDSKATGWAGRTLGNVPFVPAFMGAPAKNWFGEDIHTKRGDMWGEIAPMLAHRVSPQLIDDPQMQFVAKMGANQLQTGRRFKTGGKLTDDITFMRKWAEDSGKELRQWLTPERMAKWEAALKKDPEKAQKDFDSAVLELRTNILKRYKTVEF